MEIQAIENNPLSPKVLRCLSVIPTYTPAIHTIPAQLKDQLCLDNIDRWESSSFHVIWRMSKISYSAYQKITGYTHRLQCKYVAKSSPEDNRIPAPFSLVTPHKAANVSSKINSAVILFLFFLKVGQAQSSITVI